VKWGSGGALPQTKILAKTLLTTQITGFRACVKTC
jgi:hypothetical protein